MLIEENISLLPHNTFGIDVYCRYFSEYNSVEELQEILKSDICQNNATLPIGRGSNLLFINDFDGLILHSGIKKIEVMQKTPHEVHCRVGSGMLWDDFVQFAVENGYGGIENLSAIPGEVGASAVQNIGAYGVEAKDTIVEVEAVERKSGRIKIFSNEQCRFDYRDSVFKHELKDKYVITYVTFRLLKKPVFALHYGNLAEHLKGEREITLERIRSLIIGIREEKLPDPAILGNAGSFFVNPIVSKEKYNELKNIYPSIPGYSISSFQMKIPAAWLIEQTGWKGKSFGRAAIYEKQALVLVNKGGSTAQEILTLADKVTESVKDKFDVDIYPEVTIIE